MPNMILVKVICYVNVENHFLTFTKHITFTRIMLGTPLVISARSAHSDQTKKSVHISEWVCRMCNTSPRLPWEEAVVPHLTEYCRRMMAAGYSQTY